MFVATVIACIIFAGYILYSVGRKYLGYNPHSKRAKAYLKTFTPEKAREFSGSSFDEYLNDKAWDKILSDDEIEAMR